MSKPQVATVARRKLFFRGKGMYREQLLKDNGRWMRRRTVGLARHKKRELSQAPFSNPAEKRMLLLNSESLLSHDNRLSF